MRAALLRVLAMGLVLAAPFASAETPAPAVAAAYTFGPVTVVTWTPSMGPVDGYHIYGLGVSGEVLLTNATSADTTVVVPAGYEGYSVRAYVGAEESSSTYAVPAPCVWVNATKVPPAGVNPDCPPNKTRATWFANP